MSESIKGSKSSLYIKEEVPGVTNSGDTIEHMSVQNLWGSRGAADVISHGVYKDTTLPVLIEAGSVKRKIRITGHNAIIGDFVRMNNGNADGEEVTIIKVIDADWFVISKEINASVGDECFIMKPVTPTYAKDGTISVSQGPVQYNDVQVGTPVEVTMDAVTVANIKALPTELIFKKDGINKRVSYDSVTPTNSDAIPVNIVTVNGTGIQTTVDLSGAQVNVQLSHQGTNPDSVQIGQDGVGIVDVEDDGTHNNLRVHDKKTNDTLTDKTQLTQLTDGLNEVQVYNDTVNRHLRVHDKLTLDELVLMNDKLDDKTQLTQITDGTNEAQVYNDTVNRHLRVHDKIIFDELSLLNDKFVTGTIIGDVNLRAGTNIVGRVGIDQTTDGTTNKVSLGNDVIFNQEMSADGVTPFNSQAINRTAQKAISTIGADYLAKSVASITLGFDGDEHREISLDSTGRVNISSSQLPATLDQKNLANSLSVAQALNHSFEVTQSYVSKYEESVTISTTATPVISAMSVKKLYIQALDTNSSNLRVKITDTGVAATPTSGWQLQPGRSDSFEMGGATCTVSVCSESGSGQGVVIQYA